MESDEGNAGEQSTAARGAGQQYAVDMAGNVLASPRPSEKGKVTFAKT